MSHVQTSTGQLLAPLSGVLIPLDLVPDPVFAQRMVGDGVSIDPTSTTLLAPCAGEVIQAHSAGHAVTIRMPGGPEVMIHIGLDTVHLKGRGFTAKVKTGQKVEIGTPLIEFDPDFVATAARSLMTQILITTPDLVTNLRPATGRVTAGKDAVLLFDLRQPAVAEAGTAAAGATLAETVIIVNPAGLHARPASVLVGLSRRFKAEVRLQKGSAEANARSLVGIMNLDVRNGDKVQLLVRGVDAAEAMATILPELRSGLGEKPGDAPVSASAPVAVAGKGALAAVVPVVPADARFLPGIVASPGLAFGRTVRISHAEIVVAETGAAPGVEQRHLRAALEAASGQLTALHDRLVAQGEPGKAGIFAAHNELLEDPDLLTIAESAIAKGKSAAFAWRAAINTQADRLAGMSNELLAGRANDLRDVGRRVLQILCGGGETKREFPADCILLAEDLTPSDTVSLDRSRVLGFCTVAGGATSHVAILARSLGIPALVGMPPAILEMPDQTEVILDGEKGLLCRQPTRDEVTQVRGRQEKLAAQRQQDLASATAAATTCDGHTVHVVANIGNLADAQEAVRLGADGVGLLRTEFLFLNRTTPPTEDEQTAVYTEIARALGPDRPLIIRTLDVGGDKPLAYLPIAHEENPFLGERGLRVGLNRPDVLRTQLRAILRAGKVGKVKVMFPMVTLLEEWRTAKAWLDEEARALGLPLIPAGIMIEVPAAALTAAAFAPEVDFFSIGTNDLTQYVLAMDRGHPKLAGKIDALHPGVLRLIGETAAAAQKHGKHCGVCGGLASDPRAAAILVGLGVDELSVSVPAIPTVKAGIRRIDMATCRSLAEKAVVQPDPAAVRALLPGASC